MPLGTKSRWLLAPGHAARPATCLSQLCRGCRSLGTSPWLVMETTFGRLRHIATLHDSMKACGWANKTKITASCLPGPPVLLGLDCIAAGSQLRRLRSSSKPPIANAGLAASSFVTSPAVNSLRREQCSLQLAPRPGLVPLLCSNVCLLYTVLALCHCQYLSCDRRHR
jgi:hypothetical protein